MFFNPGPPPTHTHTTVKVINIMISQSQCVSTAPPLLWSTASLCLGGSDIFASVRENSPTGLFIANISISGEPGGNAVWLCLTGANAHWFYLEGRTIRLNTSLSRVLDREVHLNTPVTQPVSEQHLTIEYTCKHLCLTGTGTSADSRTDLL